MKKLTTEEFIKKAKSIHKDKYDYINVNYINSKTKVEIKCNIHGIFKQKPNNHLNNHGCPKCKVVNFIKNRSSTTDKFIELSKNKHNDLYNYSKSIYTTNQKKVIIICKLHGEFLQSAINHIKGHGCPKCHNVGKLTIENFIEKATLLHRNYYNYSNVNLINSKTKIKILCPKHGEFLQSPNNHLNGQGCPKCKGKISKMEINFLNYMNIPNDEFHRQVNILNKKVDGIVGKTIFEFLGDYWHGNPNKYQGLKINETCKKSFNGLYNETIFRFNKLKNLGYNIKYVWESEWKSFLSGKIKDIPLKTFDGNTI